MSSKSSIKCFSIPDETLVDFLITGLDRIVMKDHSQVRFDGNAGIITRFKGIAQNAADGTIAFSGKGVISIVFELSQMASLTCM